MRLEKAIAAGIDLMEELAREGRMDEYHKIRLLIEAGKYHLYRRNTSEAVGSPLLPGETKD